MSLTDAEVLAANWRKARASVANGACVEVASAGARVMLRDSVDPSGPSVVYGSGAWGAFIESTKRGGLDSFR